LVDEECNVFNCHQFFGELMLDLSCNANKSELLIEKRKSFKEIELLVNSKCRRDRISIVYYPYLTSEQIKKLFYGKDSCPQRIRHLISNRKLIEKQVINFIKTFDTEILCLVEKRLKREPELLTKTRMLTKFETFKLIKIGNSDIQDLIVRLNPSLLIGEMLTGKQAVEILVETKKYLKNDELGKAIEKYCFSIPKLKIDYLKMTL
jgi:hypothetical protein